MRDTGWSKVNWEDTKEKTTPCSHHNIQREDKSKGRQADIQIHHIAGLLLCCCGVTIYAPTCPQLLRRSYRSQAENTKTDFSSFQLKLGISKAKRPLVSPPVINQWCGNNSDRYWCHAVHCWGIRLGSSLGLAEAAQRCLTGPGRSSVVGNLHHDFWSLPAKYQNFRPDKTLFRSQLWQSRNITDTFFVPMLLFYHTFPAAPNLELCQAAIFPGSYQGSIPLNSLAGGSAWGDISILSSPNPLVSAKGNGSKPPGAISSLLLHKSRQVQWGRAEEPPSPVLFWEWTVMVCAAVHFMSSSTLPFSLLIAVISTRVKPAHLQAKQTTIAKDPLFRMHKWNFVFPSPTQNTHGISYTIH